MRSNNPRGPVGDKNVNVSVFFYLFWKEKYFKLHTLLKYKQ